MVGGLHAVELEDALRHPLTLQAVRRALEKAGDVVLHREAHGGGVFANPGGAQAGLVDAAAEALDLVRVVFGELRQQRAAGGGAEAVYRAGERGGTSRAPPRLRGKA